MITKDTTMIELICLYPQAQKILSKYGMHCRECMGSTTETIEHAAKMYNIDVSLLLTELHSQCQCNAFAITKNRGLE